jgi:hypothetical protein
MLAETAWSLVETEETKLTTSTPLIHPDRLLW